MGGPIVAALPQLAVVVAGSGGADGRAVADPQQRTGKGSAMSCSENGNNPGNAAHFHANVTRRRVLRWSAAGGAVGLGATLLASSPWRAAFGEAKPYKFGTVQPLTGVAASGGKTALVGVQMAVDLINKSGGIMGRPVELIVGDDQSKPTPAGAPSRSWSARTISTPISADFYRTSASPAPRSGKKTRSST